MNKSFIEVFYHCGECLEELPSDKTPQDYCRLEFGMTKRGFQLRCIRHNLNVIHIDLEGKKVKVDTTKSGAFE